MEQQKDLAKKSRLMRFFWAFRNWLPILLCAPIVAIGTWLRSKGYENFSPITLGIACALPLLLGFFVWLYSKTKSKLVRQLQSTTLLKRKRIRERILEMPREQAISHFVQALMTPSNDLVHALAVEGLGSLKAKEAISILCEALNHPSAMVRAKAAWALGEIGDPSAIPHIIPLLGDDSPVKSDKMRPVSAYAADALSRLGEKKLVKAFDEAVQGQIRKWTRQQLSGKYRSYVVRAFVRLLDSDETVAVNAAQALEKLLLVEAIPILEQKAYSLSTPPELREICLKVLAKLNEFSRLPAIPSALPETMNLPRPATASEIDTSNLPRAARSDERKSEISLPNGDAP